MYRPHKNSQIISIKDRVAKRFLKRIKFFYKNLPEWLTIPVVNGRPGDLGTVTEMEFSNGSLITSMPTTEDSGRSEAASLLIIDEAAIVRWANVIWASAFPTLSTGGSAILASCVTGDTIIIGKNGNFRIDSVCPKQFGKMDISHLGLEVLSHRGKWQKVLGSVNKGLLETWEVVDSRGNVLKCTPRHRLYTPHGWRTVKDIMDRDLNIITYDTGISNLEEPPITIPPKVEILKPIKDFPNYMISNLGKVYINKRGELIEKEGSINNRGYRSIRLWDRCSKKSMMISNLVSTHFIGEIPSGYVTDHINCNPLDNYLTNLQIISIADNGKRAAKFSRGMIVGGRIGKGFANIKLIGQIREDDLLGIKRSLIADNRGVPRPYVTRVLDNSRVNNVQISKLKLVRKYLDNIYDICVEEDESYLTNSLYINHNTPYGVGNFFHKTWVGAMAGDKGPTDFNPIRLTWDMHPERDLTWYTMMAKKLGPRRTAQEIDGDFLASGNTVFDLMDIKAIEDAIEETAPWKTLMSGNLVYINPPKPDTRYWMGADIASGRARDYSAFCVMDRQGTEHAYYKGKIPVEKFAELLIKVGREYNFAEIAPESNDIGLAVTKLLQINGYPNIYYSERLLKEKGESRPKIQKEPGWYTTSKTRPIIIDELESDMREELVDIRNPFFAAEAYTFIYDSANRPVAMGKENKNGTESDLELGDEDFSDDSIIAEAITNYIRKGRMNNVIIAPK
jgi:hypothetical protein